MALIFIFDWCGAVRYFEAALSTYALSWCVNDALVGVGPSVSPEHARRRRVGAVPGLAVLRNSLTADLYGFESDAKRRDPPHWDSGATRLRTTAATVR